MRKMVILMSNEKIEIKEKEASKAYKNGNYKEAKEIILKYNLIEEDPEFIILLAMCHYNEGDLSIADNMVEECKKRYVVNESLAKIINQYNTLKA